MRMLGFVSMIAVITMAHGCMPKKSSSRAPAPDDGTGPGDVNILGGKPTKLMAEEETIYAQAGACVVLNVNVLDAEELYVLTEKDTTVNLTASSANVGFFSDPACKVSTKSFPIAKGEGGGGAFVTAPSSGSVKVTFSDGAQGGLGSSATSINKADITHLGSTGAGIPQLIDECAPHSIVVQDAEGHLVVVAKESTITASSTSATGKFYTDDECTKEGNTTKLRAGDSSSDSIYYKDPSAGEPSLTFADSGNASWKKATVTITVAKDSDPTP